MSRRKGQTACPLFAWNPASADIHSCHCTQTCPLCHCDDHCDQIIILIRSSLWSDHHCDQMLILWWNHYYWCSHVWSRPGWVALEDPEFESSATQAGKSTIKPIIGIMVGFYEMWRLWNWHPDHKSESYVPGTQIKKVKVMYLAPRSKKWKLWTWHPEFQKIWGMKFEESALVPWWIIRGYFLLNNASLIINLIHTTTFQCFLP